MHGLLAQAAEVEIQQEPLPLPWPTFDGQCAVGQQISAEWQGLILRFELRQQMPQRPGHLQHVTVVVQVQVQACRG
ncbi:hypothetical protein D3C81_2137240 [compost metagenome]